MKVILNNDLLITEKVGKLVLSIFGFFYFLIAILMIFGGHSFPMYINSFLGSFYTICFFNLQRLGLSFIAYSVHCVVAIYSISMVYYFGWGFGAQYYLIPSIAFCYVGKFNSKKIIYLIAIVETVIFELLYYFSEIKKLVLNNNLIIFNYNLNEIFYMFHSIIICITLILMMYYVKVKSYKVIENKKDINKVLSENASTDSLTQLLNRWAFMEKMSNIKNQKPFHFALIDIDFFKKINDTYGHSIGDEVLKIVSICIKNNFKSCSELMTRWGGEEFLIFAINCDNDSFYQACEGFREELKKSSFKINNFTVSASIGCLHIDDNFSYDELNKYIKEVDELLYKAKSEGRDKIIQKFNWC